MRRSVAASALLLGVAALLIISFVLLGNWQLRRLAWKTDLIEAVEARAFGDPVSAPQGKLDDPPSHVYRRVSITGIYQHDRTRYVKAVTELGPGFWVMTPLDDGIRQVWVNRGFIPNDRRNRDAYREAPGEVQITGLLRITEPDGTLLQANDPPDDRWYSRDVAALSHDAGIGSGANWFIDAVHEEDTLAGDKTDDRRAWPRAGLTRVEFRNTHLVYAITWYAMACLLTIGIGYVVYLERRRPTATP